MFTTKFKTILAASLIGTIGAVSAQYNADFETVSINGQGYNDGSNLQGGFVSGSLLFKNTYDTQFQSWFGFAASSVVDSITAGYTNQFGSYAGSGADGSLKFGVGYLSTFPSVSYPTVQKVSTSPNRLTSFQYTNNTYCGLSMKNGDAVAKKFGGPSGNDPDFYMVTVYNHYNGAVTDSSEIYLADYRSGNNSEDYIVKGWRTATFNFSSPFDSLTFNLKSSDNGAFGMNTPAYFCIDNLRFDDFTSIDPTRKSNVTFYPNPANNQLIVNGLEASSSISVSDLTGRNVHAVSTQISTGVKLEVAHLPSGIYLIRNGNQLVGKFVKN